MGRLRDRGVLQRRRTNRGCQYLKEGSKTRAEGWEMEMQMQMDIGMINNMK